MDELQPTSRLTEREWPDSLIAWCARHYTKRHGDMLHVDWPVTIQYKNLSSRNYYRVTFLDDTAVYLAEKPEQKGYYRFTTLSRHEPIESFITNPLVQEWWATPRHDVRTQGDGDPSWNEMDVESARAQGLSRDEIVEQLYNLGRKDLRRVAWEALLMSDGPDHISGDVDLAAVKVKMTRAKTGPGIHRSGESDRFWFTVSAPSEQQDVHRPR